MKNKKNINASSLYADVVFTVFSEWLFQQGLYSMYKANYQSCHQPAPSFRDSVRALIRDIYKQSDLRFSNIIFLSFPFALTSEGPDFWAEKSALWGDFCRDFKINLQITLS